MGDGYCHETIANELQRQMGNRGPAEDFRGSRLMTDGDVYESNKNLGLKDDENLHFQGGMFDFH